MAENVIESWEIGWMRFEISERDDDTEYKFQVIVWNRFGFIEESMGSRTLQHAYRLTMHYAQKHLSQNPKTDKTLYFRFKNKD